MRGVVTARDASDVPRAEPGARLAPRDPFEMQRTGVEGTECDVPEEETLMANGADVSTAVRTTAVRDSRPATMVTSAKDASADPLSRWLVVVPLGCLLMAMLCVAALSRLAPGPVTTSGGAPLEQQIELEPDVPMIYEVEGGGSLLRFGPAFSR